MSASDKKRLRKEQNAAAMTEKQRQAAKDAKRLKSYTVTFIVIMALVVAILVGIVVRTPIAGFISRNTHSITVGNHELSTADLSYYYVDSVYNHYSQYSGYGDYAMMYASWMEGVNFASPLGDQIKDEATGQTWAEYYIEEAIDAAKQTYGLYDKAMADSEFKLDEENQKFLDSFDDYVKSSATLSGYTSAAGYLRGRYGVGANMKTFKEYSEVTLIASEYYNAHQDSLKYTTDDYRAYDEDKYYEYSSFSYDLYKINSSSYLKGGTTSKDENGKETVTYSDKEKQDALDAAKKDAEALAIAENNTLEKLNAAIKALEINKNKTNVSATSNTDTMYNRISDEKLQEWLRDTSRKPGDIAYVEILTDAPHTHEEGETHSDDEEVEKIVSGYYVVLFNGRNDNLMLMQSVRHILITCEGGVEDEDTGEVTYSQAEWDAAKKKAEDLLTEWKNGEKPSAESFGELAKKHSADSTKSNGGLIEDIYPGQMVDEFEAWCFDAARKEGDTDVIKTQYGYHIMYYVGNTGTTYRDYMVDIDMTNEEMEKWTDGITEVVQVTKVNLSGLNRDFFLG